jgi:hypothetical protein
VAEERKLDAAARAQNRRRIYVSQRLPAIKAEIGQLKTERIKLKQDSTTTDAKKKAELRKRQTYVTTRLEILHEEQKSIAAERVQTKNLQTKNLKKGAKADTDDE